MRIEDAYSMEMSLTQALLLMNMPCSKKMTKIKIDFLIERHNFDCLNLRTNCPKYMPQILGTQRRSHGTKLGTYVFIKFSFWKVQKHKKAITKC